MEALSRTNQSIKKGQETYQIKDNEGKLFNVDFSYDESKFYFDVSFKGEVLNETFFLSLDLNDLKKSCKTFSLLDNILDMFNFIKDLFKMNKVSTKMENNSLNIIMTVPVLLKEEEIKFTLNKKINKQEDIINDLIKIITELKNENADIKKRLNVLEKWKKEKEEKEKEEKEKFNSNIMNTKEQINLININL